MNGKLIVFISCVAGFCVLGAQLDAQDKDKKIKNIFYGKIVSVDKDKVEVKFDKDWNDEKLDRKHTFFTDSTRILLWTAGKDDKSKETAKVFIEDGKGKVVPAKGNEKALSVGMQFMCPIYNGGPPEKGATIVVSGKKKKTKDE